MLSICNVKSRSGREWTASIMRNLSRVTFFTLSVIGVLSLTSVGAFSDADGCFDHSFFDYKTRNSANRKLIECLPLGSPLSKITEFFSNNSYVTEDQVMRDLIDERDVRALLWTKEIVRPTGHTDAWTVVAMVDIQAETLIRIETSAGLDPKNFRDRGFPFDYMSFTYKGLEAALWSYLGGNKRDNVDSIMRKLGAIKTSDEKRYSVFHFENDEITAWLRLMLVETLAVVIINYSLDGFVKEIEIN